FSIKNIANEVLQPYADELHVWFDEVCVIGILSVNGQHEQRFSKARLLPGLAKLQQAVQCVKLCVSIGVGSTGQGPFSLAVSYRQALESLEHSFFSGRQSVLFHEELTARRNHGDCK